MAERQHPLLNNLVTKEILKYSTVEDLASHRLVCKTWFEGSLTRWRSKATLNILQQKQGRKKFGDRSITLQELRNIFCKGGRGNDFLQIKAKPFAKYRLKKWEIKEILEDEDEDEDEEVSNHGPKRNLNECSKEELICGAENFPLFWETIGPLMRSLSFDDFQFKSHHRMPLLAIIFEHTPNLEALTFSCTSLGVRLVWKMEYELQRWNLEPKATLRSFAFDIPVQLDDLLGYFPNLENFGAEQPFASSDIKRIRENRDKITGERRLLPLKTLELGSVYSIDEVNFADSISQILDAYAKFGCLEVIKLYMAPFCMQSRDLNITQMIESAKHFEVWGNWLESLGFLRWMPNLKILEVHISCFEKRDKMPELGFDKQYKGEYYNYVTNFNEDFVKDALQSHPAMNGYVAVHLKSLYIDYEFSAESLNTLAKWMPHLKELKTILNNATLSTVCELWSDLEKLEILYGSSVDDEGITGINENQRKVGGHQTKKPNLTKLKKLKSFRLLTYCSLSKLGDISATEAFLKMGTLQFLEICVSPQMSVDVEAQLKKAIPNTEIIRNYGAKVPAHRRYGKCCKRLQFLFESVEGAISEYEQNGIRVSSPQIRRLKQLLKKQN